MISRFLRWIRETFHVFHLIDYVILIAGTITATTLWKELNTYAAYTKAIPPIYTTITILILFCLILVVFFRLVSAKRHLQKANYSLKVVRSAQDRILGHMVQISLLNSRCDQQLFEARNRRLYPGQLTRRPRLPIDLAKAFQPIILQNTLDILDHTARVFSLYTGHTCAASIKWPTSAGDTVVMATFARDSFSRANRGKTDDQKYSVKDNTASDEIYNHGHAYFVCNDLIEAAKRNAFTYARAGWQNDYTATIVLPIFYIDIRDEYLRVSETTARPAALLCVDNVGGGFDEELCVDYMKFICWRLSVMIYRWEVVTTIETPSPKSSVQ